ncbi:uncharacterized protein LOC141660246 [Apium graveolens]|uniref:uncharacterized protein LOC141660246 n=1 Tax=Apium graveolens TaxID=4045 RepID=UPI003D7B062A
MDPAGVSGNDSIGRTTKRGRPRIAVTEEVLERWRLARQKYNVRRIKREGPSRERGRPKAVMDEAVLGSQSLSVSLMAIPSLHGQMRSLEKVERETKTRAQQMEEEQTKPCFNDMYFHNLLFKLLQPNEEPGEGGEGNKDPGLENGGGTNEGNTACMHLLPYVLLIILWNRFTKILVQWRAKQSSILADNKRYAVSAKCTFGPLNLRADMLVQDPRVIQFVMVKERGNVDHSVNNGKGLYVFHVCGYTYHSLGSLVPLDGITPKFAQLHMYDGPEAVDHRLSFLGKAGEVDPTIVSMLQEMLERENALVGIFKQARKRFTCTQLEHVHLRLFERRTSDGHFQNVPTANDYEFAGLLVDNDFANMRDILQYPLLFSFGEDGYRINIKHRNANNSKSEKDMLMHGAQWSVRDSYGCRDSLRLGDADAIEVGRRVILSSSFTSSYRYMQQNFQDSLAVCKEYGDPDLFITFMCNPKWDEIEEAVRAAGSHSAYLRPDIVAWVFKIKLDAMLNDFTKKHVLVRVLAIVYTVEFQKRGLSHAHIVLWLASADKLLTPEDIDNVITAEIPDKEADPKGYKAVSQLMLHGPCGPANPKCHCMSNGRCTKLYPKSFSDKIVLDADGEPFVQRLYFHLENEQEVRFRDNETLSEVVRRVDPDDTIFIQWMLSNRYDNLGHDLTFIKYPTKFCWDASAKCWFRRKQKNDVIGRMVYAHHASGERFYMRLLLNIVIGVKTFEEIRTVDGIVYSTYKEACFYRGFLESDKEWHIAFTDASLCASASQLRNFLSLY